MFAGIHRSIWRRKEKEVCLCIVRIRPTGSGDGQARGRVDSRPRACVNFDKAGSKNNIGYIDMTKKKTFGDHVSLEMMDTASL